MGSPFRVLTVPESLFLGCPARGPVEVMQYHKADGSVARAEHNPLFTNNKTNEVNKDR
jgi:hypothetical protein